MQTLRGITRDDPTAESIYQLRWFLTLLDCETIPEALFKRAAKVRTIWGPAGNLIPAASLVPRWLRSILGQEYDSVRGRKGRSVLRTNLQELESLDLRRLERKALSPEVITRISFDILSTVMQAFPEPYSEILWQETTAQLWEVVDSTCLPFLAVINWPDFLIYIYSRRR